MIFLKKCGLKYVKLAGVQQVLFLHHSVTVIICKQGWDAANCRNADNCVDNSCQQAAAAKYKGNKVKVQHAYKPPVNPADNKQGNTNFIKHS